MPLYEVTLKATCTGIIQAENEALAVLAALDPEIIKRLIAERGDDKITASKHVSQEYDDDYMLLNTDKTLEEAREIESRCLQAEYEYADRYY